MSDETITISDSLWLIREDDSLFTLRDSTGGNALIEKEEIPALIEALQNLNKSQD
jgi:hypothetical protein